MTCTTVAATATATTAPTSTIAEVIQTLRCQILLVTFQNTLKLR